MYSLDAQYETAKREFPGLLPIPYGYEIRFPTNRAYQILLSKDYPRTPPTVIKGHEVVNLPILDAWNQFVQLVHILRQLKTEVMKRDGDFCQQYSRPVDLENMLRAQIPENLLSDAKRSDIIKSHHEIIEMLEHRSTVLEEKKQIRAEMSVLQKQYDNDINEILILQENVSDIDRVLNEAPTSSHRMQQSIEQTIESIDDDLRKHYENKQSLASDLAVSKITLEEYTAALLSLNEQICYKQQLKDQMMKKLHAQI